MKREGFNPTNFKSGYDCTNFRSMSGIQIWDKTFKIYKINVYSIATEFGIFSLT